MRISVANANLEFSAERGRTLLEAALPLRLNLPHGCKSGNCGACRARLLEGEIVYPNGPPLGLSGSEVAEGMILLCQAQATTDVRIETFPSRLAADTVIKRLPCRIERVLPLAHDVMAVHLRLPIAEAFHFAAGQYIDILLSGGRRRSFSIASVPSAANTLELHVRLVPGGAFSEPLYRDDCRGALLDIEGPRGSFLYREGTSPMLLIGGGTGVAPLISMLRYVVRERIDRDISIFWGVRSERDLYANSTLQLLAQQAARLRYVAVLSQPSSLWQGLTGWVHQAALNDTADLEAHDVYASGPPAMVAAVRGEFERRRAASVRLYLDSFDYACDPPARQRISAFTKS